MTTPPDGGKPIALYDGHCRFCTSQVEKLCRTAHGKLTIRSFQEPGVLVDFPGLTHADCMRELKVVDVDGQVFGGAEAVVRTLLISRPILGQLARLYDVPGLRWGCDRLYAFIARNRYRFFGRSQACEDDACSVHFQGRPRFSGR